MSEPDPVADANLAARRAGERFARKIFGFGAYAVAFGAFGLIIIIGYFGVQFVSAVKTTFGPICEEISRVTSPDGRVDAVLVKDVGGGAARGFRWYVYVLPVGNSFTDSDHSVFFAGSNTQGLNVEWTGDKQLAITYRQAHIRHFSNFAYPLRRNRDNTSYEVRITESRIAATASDSD